MIIDREKIKIYFEPPPEQKTKTEPKNFGFPLPEHNPETVVKNPRFPYISVLAVLIVFAFGFISFALKLGEKASMVLALIIVLSILYLIIRIFIYFLQKASYHVIMKEKLSQASYDTYLESVPNDMQIDEWLKADIDRISNESYEKLSIDKNELIDKQEVFLGLPTFWDTHYSHKKKIGKDGLSRYSHYTINCLNFTNKQVLMFTCLFNFISGVLEKEKSFELFYNDIVSVDLAKDKVGDYNFELHTTAGTKFSLPIISGAPNQEYANQVIKKIRLILRSKKN